MAQSRITLQDMALVCWGPTLKLALARGVASGLILAIMALILGAAQEAGLGAILLFFFVWAIGSALAVPMMVMMIRGINAMFAAMGLGIAVLAGNIMLWMLALAVAIGDPLVYALNRQFPDLLEVRDFKFFNLQPTLFVFKDDEPAPIGAGKADFL